MSLFWCGRGGVGWERQEIHVSHRSCGQHIVLTRRNKEKIVIEKHIREKKQRETDRKRAMAFDG